jgi:hypothetical protein
MQEEHFVVFEQVKQLLMADEQRMQLMLPMLK